MSKADFVKNNSDYGRDITDPGKELSPEYLGSIYDGIREEEIRTEGEGADGSMTVERWKDVLRGSAGEEAHANELPTIHDAEDLTELVLEHVWMPIMSAIGALWGVKQFTDRSPLSPSSSAEMMGFSFSGMLGAQGARLGMNMASNMLVGVRQLGRNDIFCKIFNCVCKYSGLLDCNSNAADRTWTFANSVEKQSAFVVALRIARDAHDEIGSDGWKRIWLMLFELRDLKMLGGGVASRIRSILMESDPDLLKEDSRRDWTMKLIKRGKLGDEKTKNNSGMSSMFGSFASALFGSVDDPQFDDSSEPTVEAIRTVHGKEDNVVWDELAPSDDEDERDGPGEDSDGAFSLNAENRLSLGAQFESILIQEDMLINRQREMPVTGLERVDDTPTQVSPRARVRKRLVKGCDFAGLVLECRFMDDEGICSLLQGLLSLTRTTEANGVQTSSGNSTTVSGTASEFSSRIAHFPVSPASEAFAEVLICEVALRNKDRLTMLWHNHLKAHYCAQLQRISQTYTESENDQLAMINGPIEKAITGLLRISCCAVQRGEIVNDVLETWSILDAIDEGDNKVSLINALDRHLGEGLWRITRHLDDSTQLEEGGWRGLLALTQWCACRGGKLPPVHSSGIGRPVGLAEDDPALHAYRSLHFMLNVSEVKASVPPSVVQCIRTLVTTGEYRNCPKLSIAGLDLLHVLNNQIESTATASDEVDEETKDLIWKSSWRPVLESMAEASQSSSSSVSSPNPVSFMYCAPFSNCNALSLQFIRAFASTPYQCSQTRS
jgi:hypothetical protein